MPTPINMRMGASEWAMLILLSILWGGSFFFLEIAIREVPPFTLVFCRLALAAMAMLGCFILLRRPYPRRPGLWGALFLLAILNNVIPFSLFAFAQQHITSGLASILNATTPLWGVMVAHFATTDEKANPTKIVGVGVGVAGVAVMIGGTAVDPIGQSLPAQLACLGATLSYALAGVYGRRFRAWNVAPFEVATGQLVMGALLILPIALLFDAPWGLPLPNITTLLAIGGLALLSTTLAYLLYFTLIARSGATNTLLVTLLIPVTTILLGIMLLGETMLPRHWAGMGLIALGLVAIDGRLFESWPGQGSCKVRPPRRDV